MSLLSINVGVLFGQHKFVEGNEFRDTSEAAIDKTVVNLDNTGSLRGCYRLQCTTVQSRYAQTKSQVVYWRANSTDA